MGRLNGLQESPQGCAQLAVRGKWQEEGEIQRILEHLSHADLDQENPSWNNCRMKNPLMISIMFHQALHNSTWWFQCRGWDLLPGQITSCGPWRRPGTSPENRKLEELVLPGKSTRLLGDLVHGLGGPRQVVQDGKAASQLLAECWKHLQPSLAWSHGGRQWSMINFRRCFWRCSN